jgi:hypothetical protein
MTNELVLKVNALEARMERLEAKLEDAIDMGKVKLSKRIRERMDDVQAMLDQARENMEAQSVYDGWSEWDLNGIKQEDFI